MDIDRPDSDEICKNETRLLWKPLRVALMAPIHYGSDVSY